MLSDIVTAALVPLSEITIVGCIADSGDLAREIRSMKANAVIAQSSNPTNLDPFLALLRSFPELKIVVIDIAGATAFVHQMRLSSHRLTELSTEALYAALVSTNGKLH